MTKENSCNHEPDWNDYEVAEMNDEVVVIHCNCRCLMKCFQRDYGFLAEGTVNV